MSRLKSWDDAEFSTKICVDLLMTIQAAVTDIISLVSFCSCCILQIGRELIMQPRLTSNLSLQGTRIAGVHHHAWLLSSLICSGIEPSAFTLT